MEQPKIEKHITKVTEIETTEEHVKNLESGEACSPHCPHCNSGNVYGMSRVVGYFSIIENWNKSKKAELKRRQKGKYWYDEV
jgi:anaerobic ribonucleoside-triphosphate reductase